jgi:hypothetical protein
MLTAAGVPQARAAVIALWPFPPPPAFDQTQPDHTGIARGLVYAGRIPDAGLVAADLAPLEDAGGGPLRALPAGLTVSGGGAAATTVREVLGEWARWYRGYFVATGADPVPPAWDPHRQEYRFAVQAQLPSARVVLHSEEYTSGRVDWTDFDAVPGDIGETPASRVGGVIHQVRLPAPATFPGMPADRFWEFEDSRVYLGDLEAGPTDLTRMALIEFSLAFGVDWFVLPLEVPAGSVIRVGTLRVLDTFGRDIAVGPTRQAGGWSMFGLTPSDDTSARADVFIVPPVVPHVLESLPLEEVALFRDEMANLVWGVERIVQAASGEPVNRSRAATPVSLRQQLPEDLDDAAIVYRLMTLGAVRRRPCARRPGGSDRAGAAAAASLPGRRHHRLHPSPRHLAPYHPRRRPGHGPAPSRRGGGTARRGGGDPPLSARPHR